MKARGFTLLELIIVIVLIGILAAVSLPMLTAGFKAFSQQQDTAAIEREAMLALERIAREVRMSSSFAFAGCEVAFDRPEGDRVTIRQDGVELLLDAGTPATLAQGVSGFCPAQLVAEGGACYLPVRFTTEPGLQWRQLVYLRNVETC